MQIIPKANQPITKWSGGTTTELFIFPPEAEYAKRNFLFRISTATVETQTSIFTALPNYTRVLTILKGELTIIHEQQYSKKIVPFETDIFNGAWQTSAIGKVTDFNIIFAKNIKVKQTVHSVDSNAPFFFFSTKLFCFGYLANGSASLKNDSMQKEIETGDFAILNKNERYTLMSRHNCDWLLMEIEF